MTTVTLSPSDEARFWSKVNKLGSCWQWTGGTGDRYGKMRVADRVIAAHCISWEMHNGAIPEAMFIDHKCHNRGCVNPRHLRLASPKQNAENYAGANKNSTTGVRGVTYEAKRKKFRGTVMHNRKPHRVGSFDTLAEAEQAVIAKRNELFTHNYLDRVA